MNEDFESYRIDDEEEENPAVSPGGESGDRRLTMWSLMPQIMTMPSTGWEKTRRRGPLPEVAVIRFFLPLCLISGFSVFFDYFYPDQQNYLGTEQGRFTVLLVNAVIQFTSFFLGYYLSLVLEKVFLPSDARKLPSTDYGKLLTMAGVGSLAIFHIIFEALQMLDFILVFLPLWTIFIIFKGMEKSDIRSEKHILTMGLVCMIVIACPTVLEWLLALFA